MSILQVTEGIGYGLANSEMTRLGDSMYAGRNIWSGTLFQTSLIENALTFVDKAFEAGKCVTTPLPLRAILLLTPLTLALFTRTWQEEESHQVNEPARRANSPWRERAVFIQDQISNLCQVAALVSSIALIYFGSSCFGIASLAMVGMGFLDRRAFFPESIRQIIYELSPPVSAGAGLFTGSYLNIFFSFFNLFSYCTGHYLAWKEAQREIPPVRDNALDEVARFLALDEPPELEINQDYILWPTHAQEVPNIDIQALIDQFHSIEWKKTNPETREEEWDPASIETLRNIYATDERFCDRNGDPSLKSNEELIAIAKRELSSCVTMVKERRIANGAPRRYEKLIEYMKFIAHELAKTERSATERIDALLKLGIEGGEYCGPGIYDVGEEIYGGLIGSSEFFTFRSKILNCLQSTRNRAMQAIHARIFGLQQNREERQASWGIMNAIGWVVRWNDRHNIHLFQNLYGGEFGLRKAGADNDALAIADPFLKLLILCVLGDGIREMFWERHDLAEIVDTIRDAVGTPEIPELQVYAWWQACIPDLNLSDEKKQLLMDQLVLAQLGEESPGKFNRKFIKGMLLGMGVLKIRAAEEGESV